jgi:hypothetical protein
VSLTVLGLISALTLPPIFNNVAAMSTKTLMKEAFNTLSAVHMQALADGNYQQNLGDSIV